MKLLVLMLSLSISSEASISQSAKTRYMYDDSKIGTSSWKRVISATGGCPTCKQYYQHIIMITITFLILFITAVFKMLMKMKNVKVAFTISILMVMDYSRLTVTHRLMEEDGL